MLIEALESKVNIFGENKVLEMRDKSLELSDKKIFWHMIGNLGLEDMTDSKFSQAYFDDVMEIFLNRRYKKDGTGGLFVTQDKTKDMREIEIWLQMDEFIRTKFREEQGD